MATFSKASNLIKASLPIADAACVVVLLGLILLGGSVRENYSFKVLDNAAEAAGGISRGNRLHLRPCDEIYVVGEGETLHTISDKCGDPFIVEQNPHIHDPDDVFPGLVIKITPNPRKS